MSVYLISVDFFKVRSTVTWERFESAVGSELPARRAGHSFIEFESKLIMYVVSRVSSE